MFQREPLWYKNAIIYELPIKSFYDSNGDGIGDIKGAIAKLDYLSQLGVSAIWLLPFFPSPLKDDGYDIADYNSVHPDYGTLRDFRLFLKEAHKRGLKVIIELVINHTSSEHPWFTRAKNSPKDSRYRNYYVWSDTKQKYNDVRIIFQDYEVSNWTWDEVAGQYYWHRFFSHQPDLNFDSVDVKKELFRVVDFWLNIGVDGFRLDAIPYLYEREGTICENLPETHTFLKEMRAHIDKKAENIMLLSEANQWMEDAIKYFGDGDECQMAFHFPIMPRLYMALKSEDKFPIIDILEQTPEIPSNCQWGLFLRNHDELTLEMVTDEERDYMQRSYAKDEKAKINLGIRRRLAPLLDNDRRKIELMNVLLFSLPGTPFIYYGDEIGMGDNHYLGDRYGVRTPMQWSADKNAGFSNANPQKLYLPVILDGAFHYYATNVQTQEESTSSLLWWTRQIITIRKQYAAFGLGSFRVVSSNNRHVLAFLREYENEKILVAINLSRFPQEARLELEEFAGSTPKELISQNSFSKIKESRYRLTFSPFSYYWFELSSKTLEQSDGEVITIKTVLDWREVAHDKRFLNLALVGYLKRFYDFSTKKLDKIEILEKIELEKSHLLVAYLFHYKDGGSDMFLQALSNISCEQATYLNHAVIARVESKDENCAIVDSFYLESFRSAFIKLILNAKESQKLSTKISMHNRRFSVFLSDKSELIDQKKSNFHIVVDKKVLLKVYRHLQIGELPDVDMLSSLDGFKNTPKIFSASFIKSSTGALHIASMYEYINSEQSGERFVGDMSKNFAEVALAQKVEFQSLTGQSLKEKLVELIGGYLLDRIESLGESVGKMHLELYKNHTKVFKPEPFSELYLRSNHQAFRTALKKALTAFSKSEMETPLNIQESLLLKRFSKIYTSSLNGYKIRIHGNLKLENTLFAGNEFVIIDFEGNNKKTISERRLKRIGYRDLAALLVSAYKVIYESLVSFHLSAESKEFDSLCSRVLYEAFFEYLLGGYIKGCQESEGLCFASSGVHIEIVKMFAIERALELLFDTLGTNKQEASIYIEILNNISKEAE